MKLLTSFFKKTKSVTHIAAVASTALLFSACSKSDNTPLPDIAALAVTYAVPDGENVNFYLDNKLVNASSFSFGTKVDYFQSYVGAREAKVLKASNNTEFLKETINLSVGEYYSLYIVNKAANAEYLLINDKLSNPASGKAKVRFLNLAPDATALDLVIENEETKFENKAFKAHTEFVDIPEQTKVTLKLINRAAANAEVATLADVELKAGSIYTIWAKGLLTTTESAQEIAIKVSKH